MDLGHFFPFTGMRRRAVDPLDGLADQYLRSADHFSELSLDDFVPNSRIRQGFRIRGYESPIFEPGLAYHERRIPITTKDPHINLHFMDINPGFDLRSREGFQTNQAGLPLLQDQYPEEKIVPKHPEGRRGAIDVGYGWVRPRRGLPYEEEDQYPTAYFQRQRRPEMKRTVPASPNHRFVEQSYDNPKIKHRQMPNSAGRLSTLTGEYGGGRLRLGVMGQKPGAFPFDKAMKWLYEELSNAATLYGRFQEEYDREMADIKEYASSQMLDQLWAMRVRGKRDHQDSNGTYDETEPTEKWGNKLTEQKRSVVEAIKAALNASLSCGMRKLIKTATLDARKRLQQKVDTASDHVVTLLDSAMKTRENCQALREEVILLTALVDPNSDQNKSLYSEENCGDIGESHAHIGGSNDYDYEGGDDAVYVENGNDEQQDDNVDRT